MVLVFQLRNGEWLEVCVSERLSMIGVRRSAYLVQLVADLRLVYLASYDLVLELLLIVVDSQIVQVSAQRAVLAEDRDRRRADHSLLARIVGVVDFEHDHRVSGQFAVLVGEDDPFIPTANETGGWVS